MPIHIHSCSVELATPKQLVRTHLLHADAHASIHDSDVILSARGLLKLFDVFVLACEGECGLCVCGACVCA